MIESGQPGHVINTSSGDGGFAPVPMASVYAQAKPLSVVSLRH